MPPKGYLKDAITDRGYELIHWLIPDIGDWKTVDGGTVACGNCPWKTSSDSGSFHIGIDFASPMGLGGWCYHADADSGDLFDLAGRIWHLDPRSDFSEILHRCAEKLSLKADEYIVQQKRTEDRPSRFAAEQAEQELMAIAISCTEDAEAVVTELGEYHYLQVPLHRNIFLAIQYLLKRGNPVDPTAVWSLLIAHGRLPKTKGSTAMNAPFSEQAGYGHGTIVSLVSIIKDAYAKLEFHALFMRCANMADSPAGAYDKEMIAEAVTKGLERIESIGHAKAPDTMDHVAATLSDIENAQSGDAIPGFPTGLRCIDSVCPFGGVVRGWVTVIGGRPGMGKSALGLGMAGHIALDLNEPVLVLTLEMPAKQCIMRLTAHKTGIPTGRMMRKGELLQTERSHISKVMHDIGNAPIHFHDKPVSSINEIKSLLRRFSMRYGQPAAIMIDHAQRYWADNVNRTQAASQLANASKDIAMEFDCGFILLSQLNRESTKRDNPKPKLSDLKESGTIEEIADIVMMPYRPGYLPGIKSTNPTEQAEIIMAKYREGGPPDVQLNFHGPTARYICRPAVPVLP